MGGRNTVKKFLTLLLAVLMVLSLAACNSKTDAEDSRIDEDGNMTDGMETETLMTEENFAKILTEKGLGDMVTTQEINKDGMSSWTGTVYSEDEDHVYLYAIMFDYTGEPDAAIAKRDEMKEISKNFDVFFYDIKDEMLLVLGANDEYTDMIPDIIAGLGY